MKRFLCWWRGHEIVATIDMHPTCAKFIYHCSRCNRVLPGPKKVKGN